MIMKTSKIVVSALSALVVFSIAGSAMAMNQWQRKDEHRIHQGVRNGTINPAEARALNHRNYKINKFAQHAHRTGGHISLGERAKIQQMKASQRVAIFHDKHDKY
jgi:hypothetical protein